LRFEVLIAVKMPMLVFWVVMPCGLVGGTYSLCLQPKKWRQYVPPKCSAYLYLPTSSHDVTTQKINMDKI
jgi:hypothetical protein